MSVADTASSATSDPVITTAEKGIEGLRATSTWMIGVFGAIGALLVAGIQLTSLGGLSWDADRVTFGVAVGSFIIGFVAAAVVVLMHANVLAPRSLTLEELANEEARNKKVAAFVRGANVLGIYSSIDEVHTALRDYDQHRKRYGELQEKLKANPNDHGALAELDNLKAAILREQRELFPVKDRVIALGLYGSVGNTFTWAKRIMIGGALVIAVSIATFAWAISAEDDAPTPTPAEFRLPAQGQLSLTPQGRTTYAPLIGETCVAQLEDGSAIPVIVLSAQEGTYDVVTQPTEACPAPVRISVTEGETGTVLPTEPVTVAAPAAAN